VSTKKKRTKFLNNFIALKTQETEQTGGRGLGLAICSNIVDGHQGTISAYHSPDGGLGIRIEFPLN